MFIMTLIWFAFSIAAAMMRRASSSVIPIAFPMNIPFSIVGCRNGAGNGRVASDFLAYTNAPFHPIAARLRLN